MELRHLRYFVAVAEEEHLTRAAERLHISQPPLSRQIRDLEEELGVRLFERGANVIRLTEAGAAFLKDARDILRRADEAVERLRAEQRPCRERVEVGYSPTLGSEVLSEVMEELRRRRVAERVILRDLSTEESTRLVASGKLALSVQARPRRLPNRSLTFEPLFELPFRLLVQANKERDEKAIPLGEVGPLVIFDRTEYPEYWGQVSKLFRSAGVKPEVAGTYDTAASLAAAVTSGCGSAVVPSTFSVPARGKLLPILPEGRVEVGILRPRKEERIGAPDLIAALRAAGERRRTPGQQEAFRLE